MKKAILTKNAPEPIGPYNQAIKHENMLFVSGQIPVNPDTGTLVESGIIDETSQVMKNIEAILNEAEMGFNDIVKTSIFLKDMGNFAEVNAEYGKSFENLIPPARETVEVSKLPLNVNVEISCIAIKK
jgi:2-iminobutanoate/2-iminopropanoate deaminase|tara:strand:- start:427 stop:810 length:384 start_codon:yes stop_codon:yes gene_type:complete